MELLLAAGLPLRFGESDVDRVDVLAAAIRYRGSGAAGA